MRWHLVCSQERPHLIGAPVHNKKRKYSASAIQSNCIANWSHTVTDSGMVSYYRQPIETRVNNALSNGTIADPAPYNLISVRLKTFLCFQLQSGEKVGTGGKYVIAS